MIEDEAQARFLDRSAAQHAKLAPTQDLCFGTGR